MAFWLQENSRAKVNKIFHKDKHTEAHLSTSRKKQDGDGYLYSDWGFVRFLGKANTFMLESVKEGDVINIKKAMFTKEPYQKDGEKQYPKTPQLLVFDCEMYRPGTKQAGKEEEPETPDPDDIPF